MTLRTDNISVLVIRYVRDVQITDTVVLLEGDTFTIDVPHSYSDIAIPDDPVINLRQNTDQALLFVTISNEYDGFSKVSIDSTD